MKICDLTELPEASITCNNPESRTLSQVLEVQHA